MASATLISIERLLEPIPVAHRPRIAQELLWFLAQQTRYDQELAQHFAERQSISAEPALEQAYDKLDGACRGIISEETLLSLTDKLRLYEWSTLRPVLRDIADADEWSDDQSQMGKGA